jgi:hypothetical protein
MFPLKQNKNWWNLMLLNFLKHSRTKTNSSQIIPKYWKWKNLFKFIILILLWYKSQINMHTRTQRERERDRDRDREPETNIVGGHTCKNSWWNATKLNPTAHYNKVCFIYTNNTSTEKESKKFCIQQESQQSKETSYRIREYICKLFIQKGYRLLCIQNPQ